MNFNTLNRSTGQSPATEPPQAPKSPEAGTSINVDQRLPSAMEIKDRPRAEGVRPRSPQPFVEMRMTVTEKAVTGAFECDSALATLLHAAAPKNKTLMDDINYLQENKIRMTLSRKDPEAFAQDVHTLLAESPRSMKCVLSDVEHKEKPSLYIREGANAQAPEIVFASVRKDEVPLDDLAFATRFICEWQKNEQTWPNIHACYQPPQQVPPELLAGVAEAPMASVRKWDGVCDLSTVGFKPYHGAGTPASLAGRVITIKAAQGDNKMVAHAIKEQVQPGDVLVVDAGGHAASATVGGIVGSFAAKNRSAKALVVYGEMRDQVELKALGIPVFTLGCTPNGPSKVGPGSTHCTLHIGNAPFKSGDIIKIEGEQIVVVPIENAAKKLNSTTTTDDAEAPKSESSDRGKDTARVVGRKTFEPQEKAPHKNRPRTETPSFIPQLFKEFAPAHISDSASFMKPERLWGAGADLALRMGAIPDGVTLTGEAVLSTCSEDGIASALSKAKKGDFLVVSGQPESTLSAAIMEKIHAAGIGCIVVNGKAVIDEGLREKYNIPCFARDKGTAEDSSTKYASNEAEPLKRIEMSDGFTIKPGYVMMADADGIAGFSPTKFSAMYRAGYKKVVQEKASEERN
ncbi:MAG TPA: hypothetical protein VFL86_26725, partial [Burkholderiaceae bacterium]|nr:hypothetical protein [Burkholderiaceae bacterium]